MRTLVLYLPAIIALRSLLVFSVLAGLALPFAHLGFVGGVAGYVSAALLFTLIVSVLFFFGTRAEKREDRNWDTKEEKRVNPFLEYIKAKKQKVCPMITIEENSNV
jgi:uncharacterized membrane protein